MLQWKHYNVNLCTYTRYNLKDWGCQCPPPRVLFKKILDAKYEAADLHAVCKGCTHLTEDEQKSLFNLLAKYEDLFDGTLGKWQMEDYEIELRPDAKPYHAKAYPIPKVHTRTLKMEVDRLCESGVLRKVNHSEWAAPTFIIPKKDGSVRFISDFRELN